MRKFLLSFFLLAVIYSHGFAQGYHYVRDRDLYSLVRERPGSDSPVIDTLYNLQVVRTGQETGGWREILVKDSVIGWTHSSRLQAMPSEILQNLDGICSGRSRILPLVAAADLPHILVYYELFHGQERVGADMDLVRKYGPATSPVILSPDGMVVHVADLKSGKPICHWEEFMAVLQVHVYPGRLIIRDEYALYAFVAKNGETFLSVTPDSSFAWDPGYTDVETDKAIEWARGFRDWCDGRDRDEIINGSFGMGYSMGSEGVERRLQQLAAAYFRGDGRVRTLYPYVLDMIPADGGDYHSKIWMLMDIWVYENSGMVPIEKLSGASLWLEDPEEW